MLIQRMTVGEITLPLKVPFKTALRTVTDVHDLVLIIETDTGLKGYGEAPATAVITGDLLGSMRSALALIAPRLIGRDLLDFNALLATVHQSVVHHNSLKAALEIALYDLRAQQFGVPLYQLLGGGVPRIKTDVTISVNDSATMVQDCLRAVAEGFDALKVKVGGRSWREDVDSTLAIHHAVGPTVALRLDANQGWTPKQAVQVIQALETAGVALEFVEQPVKADDVAGLKFVTDHTLTPILADEAVFSVTDALHILNTPTAVLVGLVYGYLPFMVLPIYASVERFDFRYVEAAHDLGANDLWAFLRVVLPMTLPGVIAGFILVFIPTIGAFVTPDLLGGTQGIMIGNLINQQFKGQGNQPLGSAVSVVMMAMVLMALLVYVRFGDRRGV